MNVSEAQLKELEWMRRLLMGVTKEHALKAIAERKFRIRQKGGDGG